MHSMLALSTSLLSTTTLALFILWPMISEARDDEFRVSRFRPPLSSSVLRLLHVNNESVVVGGRDNVYHIGLPHLDLQRRREWRASSQDVETCEMKGGSDVDCANYIRVFNEKSRNVTICGTHAFDPMCRLYEDSAFKSEFSGRGICPFDPEHNSSFIWAEDNELYAATAADFSASDPLIMRAFSGLRTDQHDLKHLFNPQFVLASEDASNVYFFFREFSAENLECGRRVVARVARVCKDDQGEMLKHAKWTSFLKIDLQCLNQDFHYTHLMDVFINKHENDKEKNDEDTVTALFGTASNAPAGSALCRFSMTRIRESFAKINKCDSNNMDLDKLAFLRAHPLVPEPEVDPQPLYVVHHQRLLALALNDLGQIFLADDSGHILRLDKKGQLLQKVHLDLSHVNKLLVMHERNEFVIAIGDDEIVSFRSDLCSNLLDCKSCYQQFGCAWNKEGCAASNATTIDWTTACTAATTTTTTSSTTMTEASTEESTTSTTSLFSKNLFYSRTNDIDLSKNTSNLSEFTNNTLKLSEIISKIDNSTENKTNVELTGNKTTISEVMSSSSDINTLHSDEVEYNEVQDQHQRQQQRQVKKLDLASIAFVSTITNEDNNQDNNEDTDKKESKSFVSYMDESVLALYFVLTALTSLSLGFLVGVCLERRTKIFKNDRKIPNNSQKSLNHQITRSGVDTEEETTSVYTLSNSKVMLIPSSFTSAPALYYNRCHQVGRREGAHAMRTRSLCRVETTDSLEPSQTSSTSSYSSSSAISAYYSSPIFSVKTYNSNSSWATINSLPRPTSRSARAWNASSATLARSIYV